MDHCHWDLRPNTIFYDKENKKMMIYDNELINGRLSAYDHLYFNESAYFTPEIA